MLRRMGSVFSKHAERERVRTLAVYSLVVLVMLCPVLCGAAEVAYGLHQHGAADVSPDHATPPTHCPEEGDNCICQGAIQSSDVRVPGSFDAFGLLVPSLPLDRTPLHPIAHLTREGLPTGLAGWGSSLTVRAFLQNFRC